MIVMALVTVMTNSSGIIVASSAQQEQNSSGNTTDGEQVRKIPSRELTLLATSYSYPPGSPPLYVNTRNAIEQDKHTFHNFQLVSYTNTTFEGNNATRIVFTHTDDRGNRLEQTQFAVVRDNKVYLIDSAVYPQSQTYRSGLMTFQKMVASLLCSNYRICQ